MHDDEIDVDNYISMIKNRPYALDAGSDALNDYIRRLNPTFVDYTGLVTDKSKLSVEDDDTWFQDALDTCISESVKPSAPTIVATPNQINVSGGGSAFPGAATSNTGWTNLKGRTKATTIMDEISNSTFFDRAGPTRANVETLAQIKEIIEQPYGHSGVSFSDSAPSELEVLHKSFVDSLGEDDEATQVLGRALERIADLEQSESKLKEIVKAVNRRKEN